MRTFCPVALAIIFVWSTNAPNGVSAQTNPLKTAPQKVMSPKKRAQLIEGIRDCWDESIKEAGRSGDPSFIPFLRRAHSKEYRPCTDYQLEMREAMAKLGDRKSLQAIWCQVVNVPSEESAEQLLYVGGWFSIKAALKLAEQDQLYFKQYVHSDAIVQGTPSVWALAILSQIAPHPPLRYPEDHYESEPARMEERINRDLATWNKWVSIHQKRLKTLAPTGSNISLTESACKSKNQ